ncbi:MAG: hypothetical protein OXN97_19495 [Bryobacterales bacterium]|nr:hypothetical protein [Bryobacterales bacterium]
MHCDTALLARYDGFGSVTRCGHGFVHVQLGQTTLTFSEAQYQRFVAMLADSAANFEMQRLAREGLGAETYDHTESEGQDAEYPDILPS